MELSIDFKRSIIKFNNLVFFADIEVFESAFVVEEVKLPHTSSISL